MNKVQESIEFLNNTVTRDNGFSPKFIDNLDNVIKEIDLLKLLLDEKDYQITTLKIDQNELHEASQITLKAYENLYNKVDEMFYTICTEWEQYMKDEGENADIEELVGDLRKLMYGDDDNE